MYLPKKSICTSVEKGNKKLVKILHSVNVSMLHVIFFFNVRKLNFYIKYIFFWFRFTGDAPLVIARGGFSGLFPDSSFNAYSFAGLTSLTNVIVWCDVQLTKDGVGICFPDIKLDNASNVATLFKDKQSTYLVNGVSTKAWFPIDFNFKELALVNCEFWSISSL